MCGLLTFNLCMDIKSRHNTERIKQLLSNDPTSVKSMEDLVYKATDLTDYEVGEISKIIYEISTKFSRKSNTVQNLEEMRDEILTRLAEENIIAEVDPAPCLYGEPPVVEIVGKVATDDIHKYGFDHEKKAHEVNEAVRRRETFRGEKERHRG